MILLRVQYLMIMARGRTRSSIPTYVRIIRVFSSASVLLTFMSQARFSSGSQIFTMGTFADETQTTFSMPSKTIWLVSGQSLETKGEGIVTSLKEIGY